MEKKLIKSIEKELDKKIDLSKGFEENDMDSLDIMTFISLFEDYYKIKIKDKDYKKIKNFSNFKKFIQTGD
jgi:acyl carrier protein|tara:strand:+ start:136 stop:348 length:213 start_codon:yes stop_codon:yes gene_type:complete